SVMAYFLNAGEALKSAIKIQLAFHQFNERTDPNHRIHVRICIHYGKGIIEEKDIFGDVVNTAAKFLPMVNGDEIVVSEAVRKPVQSLKGVEFQPMKVPSEKAVLKGLKLFKVTWNGAISLEPVVQTLIYLKPLMTLGKKKFIEAWHHFVRIRHKLWAGDVINEEVKPDHSMVLIVGNPSSAINVARRVIDHLKLNLGQDAVALLPVQTVIDTGPFLTAGKLSLKTFKVKWEGFEPGDIYISEATRRLIPNPGTNTIVVAHEAKQDRPFYRIAGGDQQKNGDLLFLYQNALIRGENAPCFYCGDRKHLHRDCPSKQLTELTQGINHLGHLPFNEINSRFLKYLNSPTPTNPPVSENAIHSENSLTWAFHGFYELKAVYQLRLLRTIWSHGEDGWHKAKKLRDGSDKGGLLWIGQDCIRVSNASQAESILMDYLKMNNEDYRPYCLLGFLNIENDNMRQAKNYFKKALDHTHTTPQRILILFLLSRINDLCGDLHKAEQYIRRILYLSPYCPEAQYQDIIFKFRNGKKAVALSQLTKLIKKSREYFIYALIDPELSSFSEIIQPMLKDLMAEAEAEANKVLPDAGSAFEEITRYLGQDEKETSEIQALWSKIENLRKTDSYFAFLDISYFGNAIISQCKRTIEERHHKVSRVFDNLQHRFNSAMGFLKHFPYPSLTNTIQQQLNQFQIKMKKGWEMAESGEPDSFRNVFKIGKKL
ncbi:MAG: hypothetical protein JRJ85_25815, partial [Deltaproteobacteria bacterium]|nr:hypothetical protein [Deltaproteobacteria bacterium]